MVWGEEIGTLRKFKGDMEFVFGNISGGASSSSTGMSHFPLVRGRELAFGTIDGVGRGSCRSCFLLSITLLKINRQWYRII
jgi:hypothetical protein